MAKDITIAGWATFRGVPAIDLTTDGGGTARFVDEDEISDVTVSPLSVTTNGTYTAPEGEAYSPVTVNVSGGGGSVAAVEKDVNFRDYEGSLLYSYTTPEFLALQEMPENPDHTDIGLTAQGWNWHFTEAHDYVEKYGRLEVGQTYVPTDGKTHIFIHIDEDAPENRRTFVVQYSHSSSTSGSVVDWGDGSEQETFSGTSNIARSHTYSSGGDYEITIETGGGINLDGSAGSTGVSIYGARTTNGLSKYRASFYKRIWFGSRITRIGNYFMQDGNGLTNVVIPNNVTSIGTYAFNSCTRLESIVIPHSVGSIGTYAFSSCSVLKTAILPPLITTIQDRAFATCPNLRNVIIPDKVTSLVSSAYSGCKVAGNVIIPDSVKTLGQYAFYSIDTLERLEIPNSVTSIGTYALQACANLTKVKLPDSISTIPQSCFGNCRSLTSIVIPASVNRINNQAFSGCAGLGEIHLLPTTPPTLAATNAFISIPDDCIFCVPAESLEAYQTANNWSTYADRMIGE